MKKIAVIFLFILVAILPFACNKGSNNTSTTAGDDSRITSAVKDQISKEPTLVNTKIDVDTDNAIVSLKGEVRDPGQEQKAITLAKSISGVRTVHSFLKVEPEGGAGSTGSALGTAAEKTETAASDTEITTKVKLELAKDTDVSALDIHVDTLNGVVTLSGNVKSKAEIQKAIADTRKIDDVKDVRSDLKVEPEGGAGSTGSALRTAAEKTETAASDTEITTKVKLELAKDSDVSALDIHVDTLNGVVTLSGNVKSKAEIQKAIADTRKIDDVKDVRSELIVKRNS